MGMTAELLEAIIKNNPRTGTAMARIIRVIVGSGPRSKNVLIGLCGKGDKGSTVEKMLALDMLVAKGERRGTVYDVTPRVRAAAKQIPLLNPA